MKVFLTLQAWDEDGEEFDPGTDNDPVSERFVRIEIDEEILQETMTKLGHAVAEELSILGIKRLPMEIEVEHL